MTPSVGDRFELREQIGSGGMGDVWSALDRRDRSVVAVKLLRHADAKGLLRFVREQGLRIQHPNVVTPLAWVGTDDVMLFSMPLVRGGSVATLIGDYGPLPSRYAAELLRQLIAGLGAVHATGVVHRDVKPGNLLLDPTGPDRPHLRLTDFGIALPLDAPRLTTMAVVVGTTGYVAPEQRHGGDPSFAQDAYAVGAVGKEMLTGLPPGTPGCDERPDGVAESLWAIVESLTDPDPASRCPLGRAAGLLAAPDLAWEPQHEIEVFEVVGADGYSGSEADIPTRMTPATGSYRQPGEHQHTRPWPRPVAAPAPTFSPVMPAPSRSTITPLPPGPWPGSVANARPDTPAGSAPPGAAPQGPDPAFGAAPVRSTPPPSPGPGTPSVATSPPGASSFPEPAAARHRSTPTIAVVLMVLGVLILAAVAIAWALSTAPS